MLLPAWPCPAEPLLTIGRDRLDAHQRGIPGQVIADHRHQHGTAALEAHRFSTRHQLAAQVGRRTVARRAAPALAGGHCGPTLLLETRLALGFSPLIGLQAHAFALGLDLVETSWHCDRSNPPCRAIEISVAIDTRPPAAPLERLRTDFQVSRAARIS